ncbi:hypothetical protein V6N11_070269 [Hibiscus sabdariffa]|uniref:Uncharacterized protein n=1 Tax=Hibiscus sabdariffa TaxID=183260 RepID=A0ABR2QF30_9ROSI
MGKPGPAMFTDVTLANATYEILTLSEIHNWYGTDANYPHVIPPLLPGKIKHYSDPLTGCSKGGVVYTVRNNIKWLIVWSNMRDEDNKVYIDIVAPGVEIDWDSYRKLLDKSSPIPAPVYKYQYTTMATIDPSSVTPLMMATLVPPIEARL